MPVDPETVRKLDGLVRSSIQDLVDHYFRWLTASTIIVGLGIVLEIPEVWREFKDWRCSRAGLAPTGKRSGATIFLSSVGLLLVIIGVIGEGFFESLSSQAEGYLRVFDETLISDTQLETARTYERAATASREAGVASEESSDANERAGRLEIEAGVQRQRASFLEHDTEKLRRDNLATESQLSKANQDLENEKTQRLAMEEALAPRELPLMVGGGKANFSPLEPFMGTNVIINSVSDVESQRAASQIATFLQAAGWRVIKVSADPDLNIKSFDGVSIEYYSGRYYLNGRPNFRNLEGSFRCREAANSLEDLLKQYDWQASTVPGGDYSELPPTTLKIIVGIKPNRFPTRQRKEWSRQRNAWLTEHGYATPTQTQ